MEGFYLKTEDVSEIKEFIKLSMQRGIRPDRHDELLNDHLSSCEYVWENGLKDINAFKSWFESLDTRRSLDDIDIGGLM